MREILFRGQTRKKGERVFVGTGKPVDGNWVYGGVFQGEGDFSIIYSYKPIEKHTVYTDTVGQFTGLIDKNGKKIFEGDIVKIHRKYLNAGCEEDCLYEVIWHKHWCSWALRNLKPTQCCYLSDAKDGEIIGNKWDNPELLGEQQ